MLKNDLVERCWWKQIVWDISLSLIYKDKSYQYV